MSDKDLISAHDAWLQPGGPSALVLHEYLEPAEGKEGVVFPPTFAGGGYNIDTVRQPGPDGKEREIKVALIDSVGSQANRIEPLFKQPEHSKLVPQVLIKAGEMTINLLDAGHRAADALVRYSALQEELSKAFRAWQRGGDASGLAKIAPTSLVFGAWDSRDTQAKLPRLFTSTIRAFDVQPLTRSAQYNPPLDYQAAGLVEPADKKDLDIMSELGFRHAPASAPGGVLVSGEIRRDAVLSLAALRTLGAAAAEETLALRRYVLGLALVAFAAPRDHNLRQGCLLVRDEKRPVRTELVGVDGKRQPFELNFERVKRYATATAEAFGVGKDHTVDFSKEQARKAIAEKRKGKGKGEG